VDIVAPARRGDRPGAHPGSVEDVVARLERLPMTGYQRRLFAVVATGWLADQVNVALLGFLLVVLRQAFHLSLLAAGVLGSMTYLGQLIGNIAAGWAADRFGRRTVFQWTMVVWGLGAIASALAWNVGSLLFFRAVVGIGVGGEAPVAQAILCEFIPAPRRGRYVSLMEGFWSIGYVLSGALSFALIPILAPDGFRLVFALTGLLALVLFVIRRSVPESPRWYAERGEAGRADAVMRRVEEQVEASLGGLLPEPKAVGGIARTVGSPVRLLFSRRYLGRTLMAGGLWFCALLGYYGLTTWLTTLLHRQGFSVASSLGFTTVISLGGIPGFLAAAWMVEAVGRKLAMAIFLLGSAAMAYAYGHPAPHLLLGEGLAMQFFFFGMWCVLYAYTPELYPTMARASGSGWASAFGRVGAIIGPIVVGATVQGLGTGGVFTLGACAFVVAVLLVVIFGPETRGRVLEDLSERAEPCAPLG
jgi:putative MFS transporter